MRKLLIATAATLALSGAAFAQQGPFNGGGFADSGSTGTYASTHGPAYAASAQGRRMVSSNLAMTSTGGGIRTGVTSGLDAPGAVGHLGNMSDN